MVEKFHVGERVRVVDCIFESSTPTGYVEQESWASGGTKNETLVVVRVDGRRLCELFYASELEKIDDNPGHV